MKEINYLLKESISPYVNCVMMSEASDESGAFELPLYADGYPGIMFQQASNGFYLQPKNKRLSELFLYGQTLEPVSLKTRGAYRFIVFQLYPFASRFLLGVDPRELNDECYDLLQVTSVDVMHFYRRLIAGGAIPQQVEVIHELIEALVQKNRVAPHDGIQQAIKLIIGAEGKIPIRQVRSEVAMSERTLERNFLAQTGLKPKQFARIIQFQFSLGRLTEGNFEKLTHVGLDSGFNDQSHFIRVFKEYTGQTPSFYLKNTA